ncbi:hypothetical protein [Vibrio phage vB_VmeM-Yong XC32]|nr:hypothetical protein [Vibrio phage vB_VmeM-Yong XC31]QAX96539.1 hypothetical protein [Vibrio phage vB_VmeM-Yong XC32]QAX96857.1 hypothetical protein [Vibrio phage vB_VmeM-Yong MS31]QAX97162.1 hypothetical protein [Vibrio phage vB_VmeM-Yong MS32]
MFKDESLLGMFHAWRMSRRLKKAENEIEARSKIRPEEVKALTKHFDEEDLYEATLVSLSSDYLVERYTKTGAFLAMVLHREILCHGDRGIPIVIHGKHGLSAVYSHSGSPFWLPESWIPDLSPDNGIPRNIWSKTVLPTSCPHIGKDWLSISEDEIRELAPSLVKAFVIDWSKRETLMRLHDWKPGDTVAKVCEDPKTVIRLDGETQLEGYMTYGSKDPSWVKLNRVLKVIEDGKYRTVDNFDWEADDRKWHTVCSRPGIPYHFRPLNEKHLNAYLDEEREKFESLESQFRELNKKNYFSAANVKKLIVFDKDGVGYPLNSVRTSCDGFIKQVFTDCGKVLDVFYIMSDKESNDLFDINK